MPKGVRIPWKQIWPRVEALLAEKLIPAQIARELGCSQSALNTEMRRRKVYIDPEVARAYRTAVLQRIATDPEAQAKKAAAVTRAMRAPERRAIASAVSKREWSDPEARAQRIARIKAKANTPEAIEARRKAGQRCKIEHIPAAYRDLYRQMRAKHLTPAEAEAAVHLQVQRDKAAEAARWAALTPFERTLERARKHGITERPRLVANEPSYSLTGDSLGLVA